MIHSIKSLLKVKKYRMQSYDHQEPSLLPQSDLTEPTKLNIAAESQTEGNI